MKIANQQDFFSGCIFGVIGGIFSLGAWFKYPLGTASDPGAGYFSFGLGAILLVLGIMVVFSSVGDKEDVTSFIGAVAWRPIFVVLGSVVVFGFSLPRFGIFVALPALVIISSLASHEFRIAPAVISAIVLTALCYALFVKGLGLNLPI